MNVKHQHIVGNWIKTEIQKLYRVSAQPVLSDSLKRSVPRRTKKQRWRTTVDKLKASWISHLFQGIILPSAVNFPMLKPTCMSSQDGRILRKVSFCEDTDLPAWMRRLYGYPLYAVVYRSVHHVQHAICENSKSDCPKLQPETLPGALFSPYRAKLPVTDTVKPPKIMPPYLLKTLFAKFKLFFSSFSTPSVLLTRDHIWDCPKVVFKTTFGQSQRWS